MDVVVRARRSDAWRHPASSTTATTMTATTTLPTNSTGPSTSTPRSRTVRPPTPIGSQGDRPIDTATATDGGSDGHRRRPDQIGHHQLAATNAQRPEEPPVGSLRGQLARHRQREQEGRHDGDRQREHQDGPPLGADLAVHRPLHLGRDADLVIGREDERSLTEAICDCDGEVLERDPWFEVGHHDDAVAADIGAVGLVPARREQHVGLIAVERELRGARGQEIGRPADHADDPHGSRRPIRVDVTAVTGRLELIGEERGEDQLVAHLDTRTVGEQLVDGHLIRGVGIR